jgi:hypothetical protein
MTDPDCTTPLDDDFIDRIVDGAMTPCQLRAAIDRLDREPDGWKRCAVAFLEAQCWREAFRTLDQPAGCSVEVSARLAPPDPVRKGQPYGTWHRRAMAAGLIAASFAIGWLGHSPRRSAPANGATPPAAPVVMIDHDRPKPPPGTPGVVDPSRSTEFIARQPRDDRSPPNLSEVVRAVGRLRIGSNSGNAEVPILAGPGINEEWIRDQPPPLSEHGQALWQRHGFQVDQRRRIITATLADGRRVTVPIDQVEFRYTGNSPL